MLSQTSGCCLCCYIICSNDVVVETNTLTRLRHSGKHSWWYLELSINTDLSSNLHLGQAFCSIISRSAFSSRWRGAPLAISLAIASSGAAASSTLPLGCWKQMKVSVNINCRCRTTCSSSWPADAWLPSPLHIIITMRSTIFSSPRSLCLVASTLIMLSITILRTCVKSYAFWLALCMMKLLSVCRWWL